MSRLSSHVLLLLTALSGIVSSACQSGGVGDPCIPEDEYNKNFSGYQVTEVNVESRSFQCETRVCLVANFQGRVSCPFGQPGLATVDPTKGPMADPNIAADDKCYLPGTKEDGTNAVTVPVTPQLIDRSPDSAVYCSCRCAGDDSNASYCSCPSGYLCQPLVNAFVSGGGAHLVGSYCIKDGTQVNNPTTEENNPTCSLTNAATMQARPAGCGTEKHPDGI
ncbi:MAG TPA: hypothetical protein VH062_15780 [Polyangiaceae bacterium]|nr:hypothetical protein [Polyangiaceae bacterium]